MIEKEEAKKTRHWVLRAVNEIDESLKNVMTDDDIEDVRGWLAAIRYEVERSAYEPTPTTETEVNAALEGVARELGLGATRLKTEFWAEYETSEQSIGTQYIMFVSDLRYEHMYAGEDPIENWYER